jgi:hypothetical protein
MAEMGLGYGSEYQLLRFLGHHRIELNDIIHKNTKLTEEFVWMDFPKDKSEKPRLSLDEEYKNIEFLSNLKDYEKIKENWKNYWPSRGQHWDAIILNTDDEKWGYVMVEAKAHLQEGIEDGTQAENEKSRKQIENAFKATQKRFNIDTKNSWLDKYYQFANRLAFVNFMLENGIECSLLNIYFINGYVKRDLKNTNIILEDKSVSTVSEWRKLIDTEYDYLGINDEAKKYISKIFVEC